MYTTGVTASPSDDAHNEAHGGRIAVRQSLTAWRTKHRPPKHPNVLPGFGLSLGYTLTYLGLIVLLPLSAAFIKTAQLTWPEFIAAVTAPRVVASYRLTFGAALGAASINAVFGLLVAWVLVRYRFPGRLPIGIKVAYTPLGVLVALTFIGLPFVVRTVQPVLEQLPRELEEVAATLGASRWQSFRRVVFPILTPALLTGFALAFARAIGEYGSVIFIAGNMPMVSEITPLLIITKLEQYDYAGATAIAMVMLLISFLLLLVINGVQAWSRQRQGAQA